VAPRAWRLGALAGGKLSADPEQFRIALDALLENAVKYSEAGDRIELASHANGTGVVIEITDDGIGVPDEALTRIFERFGRVDAARTRTDGGVGLGLAIVDTIVKAHGGHSSVRRRGRGSVFALHLPGFRPATAKEPRPSARASAHATT
jgi:two-component system sensor histidine kinase SenX3